MFHILLCHTISEICLYSAQSKLTASRFLRVRKLTTHVSLNLVAAFFVLTSCQVQDKLDKIANGRGSASPPTNPTTPRSSSDTRSLSSRTGEKLREGEPARSRAEDVYEILCNDVLLPLDMTLAAVRQYIWRQNGELTMHYRRKAHTNGVGTAAIPPVPSA